MTRGLCESCKSIKHFITSARGFTWLKTTFCWVSLISLEKSLKPHR
ncbi:DUF3136 domain-containing protein [Duganella sp. FT27W]|nr:DUF3136 domain-containing protein [Duganella sp. FT27W]